MGFIMQQGNLTKLGISSYPGVTFSSPAGWGMGTGHQPGQAVAEMRCQGPHTNPTQGHFPPRLFKKAFASNAPEQIELEPNKAVVICKLEMLQSAQD